MLNFLWAALPLLLVLGLLVGLRWSAKVVMGIALLVTALIALWQWAIPGTVLWGSLLQGWGIALNILYIVFGALLLLQLLLSSGAIATIRASLIRISPDRRVQAILAAWCFGSFMEGVAGFGTPAAVAAPLLVAIGFPAVGAVMVALMIQST